MISLEVIPIILTIQHKSHPPKCLGIDLWTQICQKNYEKNLGHFSKNVIPSARFIANL